MSIFASVGAFAEVTINEVMAKNGNTLVTASGVKEIDWVELYNSGIEEVDLSGWCLGNDPTKKTSKWPVIEGSCIIPANGYKIVWCDGDGLCTSWAADEAHVACNVSTEAGKHTVFLASEANKDAIVCQVPMPAGIEDVSYGYASATDNFRYFPTPTPGTANPASGRTGFTPKVVFSEPHGYKSESFQLTLSCPDDSNAQIYYTLNGRKPTVGGTGSTKYTGPITISKTTVVRAAVPDADSLRQNDTSATYLFISDILTQTKETRPDGFPSGNVNNQTISYGMRSASSLGDVDAATATARLYDGFTNGIRTVSLVFDPDGFFSSGSGIYVNAHKEGDQWECPTMIEQIYPVDTNDEFSAQCGVKIRGAWSRNGGYPKHAFRLFFRNEYGMGSLNHPLFGADGPQSFGKIDLRCEQNCAWANNQSDNTMIHEVFSRDSQRDMGQPYNKSHYYHLFLNGCYWGIYQTEERVDQKYCADNVGGAKENYDVARTSNVNNGSGATYTTGIVEGETAAWEALWNISMKEGYGSGHEANYYKVRGLNPDGTRNPDYPIYLNVTNLICFMLTSQYTADYDSPANKNNLPNNIIAYRNRVEGDGDIEGFLWNRHDSEQSLGHGEFGSNVAAGKGALLFGTRANGKTELADFNPQMLHYELCANPEYRRTFADLVQKHILTPGGAMSPEKCKERYSARMAQIDDAVMAELARWGKSWTRSTWTGNCTKDLSFFDQRTSYLINNYRDSSLKWFPSIDAAKVLNSSALELADGDKVDAGDRVYLSGGNNGTVYYTTDGSDPCLSNGDISGSAQTYTGGAPGVNYASLFAKGSSWKYYDAGAKPAADWYAADYNDSAWKSGSGKLGFASSGTFGTTINRYVGGGSSGTQVTTYYFRRTFTMPAGAARISSLRAAIDCDDGYIVYINGVEVKKDQVASSDYSAFSTATNMDPKEMDWTFDSGLLHEGANTIAVEVHQCNATSSDAWWDLALSYPDTGSAVGGIVVPQTGFKLMARVKSGTEWSALSEVRINAVVPKFFTGDYDEPVLFETSDSFVLSNANFNAGIVVSDGVIAKLKAADDTVNTISVLDAAGGEVRFTGEGTVKLEGADTLATVSNLVVKSGTLDIKSTGVSANKTPVVNVLGFVEQTGGTINLDIDVGMDADKQIYGIYVANKDKKDVNGDSTVYALFDGGLFNARVGGNKSSAVYINKKSVDTTFKGGETLTAVLNGVDPRFVSASGDLKLKRFAVDVTMTDDSTSVGGARAFKSDKSISITDGHYVVSLPEQNAEIFSAADSIRIDGGVFELEAGDDCFSAMTNITVNGGLVYAVSLYNDVFDSNGDMELNGGTILAYTTANGHEAFDVEPEQTESGGDVHQLRINGGTIFATGGKSADWPDDLVSGTGVTVFQGEDLSKSDYSAKYLTLTGAANVKYTARLPEFPESQIAVLATCPGFTGTPSRSSVAPSVGDQDFHDYYIDGDLAEGQDQIRVHTVYGSTLGDGDTDEYIVLTNTSASAVQLYGFGITSAKDDGESAPKLDIVLGERSVEPFGSIRLDQADFAAKGWDKITNGKILMTLTSFSGELVQTVRGDFGLYEECDGCGAALVATKFGNTLEATTEYWTSSTGPHVHVWGEPEYKWTKKGAGYVCTASAVCTLKSSHVTNETVTASYRVTRSPTIDETGTGIYTATFACDAFETQTTEVVVPKLPDPSKIGSFLHFVNFTVAGYTGANTLERFPVLVRLAANLPAGFDYSACAEGGADLRFSDAEFNPIPHEIEKWDPNGESLVWVLLPAMANGTTFTMYFAGTPLTANDPTAVWKDYTGVGHMSEASGTVKDSTGHGLDAVPNGANKSDSVAYANGPAGNARQFATAKGNKTYLLVPNYNSFGLGSNFTIQGWFKATGCFDSYSARYISRKDAYTDGNGWEFEQRYGSGDTPSTVVSSRGAASGDAVQSVPNILSSWLDLAIDYNGGNVQYYVNGAKGDKVSITAATDNGKSLAIGCNPTGSESNWVGQMDEIRLRKGDVTADRMLGEHETIANPVFLSSDSVQTFPRDKPVLGEVTVVTRATVTTVSGSVSILGDGATACDVYFAYGTEEGSLGPSVKIASDVTDAFEYVLGDLIPSTTYYYELSVTNNAETAADATKVGSFTTEAPPAPPAFGALEVRAKSRKAVFAGSIASVGNDGASSCDVYLSIDGAAATKIAEGATASFNYTVIGLELDTTYAYTLSISNDADTVRGASLSGSFTTLATEEGLQPVAGDAAATRSLIQEAIDDAALESPAGTVILGEGIFEIDETLNVTGGVSLVGQGSDLTTIKPGASAKIRCVMIDNGAKLEGVALTGGNAAYGAGAWVRNGTVSWCRVENCYGSDTSNGLGAGVSFTQGQGQIDHCTVTGCSGNTNFRGVGIGSYQQAGAVLVDTCLVFGNKTPTTTGWGAAVGMKDMSADTTVRNCTITGNQSQMYGSVHGEGGSGKLILVNDIIVGNKLNNGDEMNIKSDSGALDKTNSKNCFFGLGAEAAVIPGSFSGDPMFSDAANGDYRLMEGSPAFGKGASYSGIGVDLAGNDFADPPSIGCFEFGNFAASPVFAPESSVFNDPISVTISCRTDGATIRYTTDESDPTEASALYEGPVVITDTTTFKAVAFKIGKDPSPVVTKTYVHKDGILPGATPAETTKTIQDAIDAAAAESPAGTVILSASLFEINAQLFVTNGVTLQGAGADKTIIKQTTSGTSARCVQVRSGAKLVGLTLTGGRMTSNWNYGAAALVDNGTISWCCISNNVSTGNNLYGGALSIEGDATIDHTVIAENTASGMTDFGGAIGSYNKSYSLVIDTCLIYGNSAPNSGNGGGYGGAIATRGGKPKVEIRNTTITGNSAIMDGGAISFDGNASFKLINCIVSGNLVNGVENNIAGSLADGSEGNLIGGNPGFVNAAKGNYRLKLTSSAVGIGKTYSGIAEDLDKVARKDPPAAGCYEVGDTPIYEPGWTAEALTADPSGICTDGELVYAYARGDYMVNGVAFSGVGSSVLAIDNANVSWTGFSMTAGCTYGDVEDAGYKGLLENSWACMHTYSHTVTLKNLTVGKTYLIQLIGARNNGSNDAQVWVEESGDESVFIKAGGTGWTYGGSLVGIFTAESETTAFTLKFVDTHQDWMSWNAIQVRELGGKPEPEPELPTYIQGKPKDVVDKYNAWAETNGADTESAFEESFLLDCGTSSEALAEAKAAFRIISIAYDATSGKWVCLVTGEIGEGEPFGNGYIHFVSVKSEFEGAGEGSDFFKATLEYAPVNE